MTVLVTGATGRVGARFVPRLIDHGIDVRILVRDATRAEGLAARSAEVVEGDLLDGTAVAKALDGITGVVHLAAVFRGAGGQGASEDAMVALNQHATVDLARAALGAGVERFVNVTTTLTYTPGPQRPQVETDEQVGGTTYPGTKAAAEAELRSLHDEAGLPLRTARLAFVYGDGDPHLAESLMWARNWPLHQRLHLVHHADVAQALIRLLVADGLDGTAVNVADDAPVTASELLTLNGEEPAADAATRPLDDPWAGIADTTRLRTVLRLRPIYPTVYTAKDAGAL